MKLQQAKKKHLFLTSQTLMFFQDFREEESNVMGWTAAGILCLLAFALLKHLDAQPSTRTFIVRCLLPEGRRTGITTVLLLLFCLFLAEYHLSIVLWSILSNNFVSLKYQD